VCYQNSVYMRRLKAKTQPKPRIIELRIFFQIGKDKAYLLVKPKHKQNWILPQFEIHSNIRSHDLELVVYQFLDDMFTLKANEVITINLQNLSVRIKEDAVIVISELYRRYHWVTESDSTKLFSKNHKCPTQAGSLFDFEG
jgi:hypothetical protein